MCRVPFLCLVNSPLCNPTHTHILRYLEHYLIAHDIALYFCLNICFAVGVSFLDILHFPFIAMASLIVIVPKSAPYLWGFAVTYAQCFILYQYWDHYKHPDAHGAVPTDDGGGGGGGSHGVLASFRQQLALPVVFFVFACRQFAVYIAYWRRGARERMRRQEDMWQLRRAKYVNVGAWGHASGLPHSKRSHLPPRPPIPHTKQ